MLSGHSSERHRSDSSQKSASISYLSSGTRCFPPDTSDVIRIPAHPVRLSFQIGSPTILACEVLASIIQLSPTERSQQLTASTSQSPITPQHHIHPRVYSTDSFNMADAPRGGARGGGFGDRGRGDRGRGDRGRGRRGPRRGGNKSEEKECQPVTKLGRLVKAGKITSMEQIYLHSLPIKEYQIVDHFLPKLKDEVMKVRQDPQPTP